MKTRLSNLLIDNQKIPFYTFTNDYIGDTIEKWGCWEPQVTSHFVNLVKNHKFSHFLDVGAHYGYYSAIFQAIQPTAKISCIEPNPVTREMTLDENVRSIDIKGYAICDLDCPDHFQHFKFNPRNSGGCRAVGDSGSGNFIVENQLLVDIVDVDTVDLLKIDVEGLEYACLRALHMFGRLKHIYMELSPSISLDRAREALESLQRESFEVFDLGIQEAGPINAANPKKRSTNELLSIPQTNIYATK